MNTADSTRGIRTAGAGLVWHAAGEEALLLAAVDEDEEGTPSRWSACATLVHNSEFREEQVHRLIAVRERRRPSDFPRIDHEDPDVYARLAAASPRQALERSRASTTALLDAFAETLDEDLLDPSRHDWLGGRMLWLQIVVRGFWHPLGHVGEYYLRHEEPHRAVRMHAHAVAVAQHLGAPAPALGMAYYSLSCASAASGDDDEAVGALAEAVALNDDLRGHAAADTDLERLRRSGRIDALVR